MANWWDQLPSQPRPGAAPPRPGGAGQPAAPPQMAGSPPAGTGYYRGADGMIYKQDSQGRMMLADKKAQQAYGRPGGGGGGGVGGGGQATAVWNEERQQWEHTYGTRYGPRIDQLQGPKPPQGAPPPGSTPGRTWRDPDTGILYKVQPGPNGTTLQEVDPKLQPPINVTLPNGDVVKMTPDVAAEFQRDIAKGRVTDARAQIAKEAEGNQQLVGRQASMHALQGILEANPDMATGPISAWTLEAKQALAELGALKPGQEANLNAQTAFQTFSKDLATKMRQIGSGAMSDLDLRTFMQVVPNLGNNKTANAQIILHYQQVFDYLERVQQARADYVDEFGTMGKSKDYKNIKDYVKKTVGSLYAGKSAEDLAAMPKGWKYRDHEGKMQTKESDAIEPPAPPPAAAPPTPPAGPQTMPAGLPFPGSAPVAQTPLPPPGRKRWDELPQ